MRLPTRSALVALGLFIATLTAPGARADAFEDANRAFAAGQFADSARGFEAVLKKDGYSPAALFDLGNANMRLGKTGDAILDYERAKWLAPHDPDIAANLRFARKRAGFPAEDASWSEAFADFFSANAWAWLGSGALVVLCAGILGNQLYAGRRGWFAMVNVASFLVLVTAAGAVALRFQETDRAILPARSTPALISPFAGAKTVAEFSAGQAVQVEKEHGGFYYVRDSAGHAGWVASAQVAMLVPGSSS